jgi:hypothetical protein
VPDAGSYVLRTRVARVVAGGGRAVVADASVVVLAAAGFDLRGLLALVDGGVRVYFVVMRVCERGC